MTNIIEAEFEKLEAEFSPERKAVENDAKAIVSTAWNYIETNGLHDLYAIALTVVGGAVAGTPWASILASVTAQGIADGKTVEQGAVAVVAATAQADLIAAGTLLPPVASAPAA